MATRRNRVNRTNGQEYRPPVERFHDVEALNEFYAANQWAAEYIQVKAAPLIVEVAANQVNDVMLALEKVDQLVVGSARSHEGLSILLPMHGPAARVCGRSLDRDKLLVVAPNSDMEIVLGAGTEVISLGFPVDMLSEHLVAVGDDDSLLETQNVVSLQVHERFIERLWRVAFDIMSGQLTGCALDSRLASLLARVVIPATTTSDDGLYRRLNRQKTIERARQYIHEHLAEPILIPDLCSHCGVSLRTLERLFKAHLDTTPNRYVLAARLAETRRDLANPELAEFSIANIAMSNGFTHMGRFAQQYSQQFGRLPSADRGLAANRS